MSRARILCAAPGCDKALYENNRSGVCRDHAHAPGLCQCKDCQGISTRRKRARRICAVHGCEQPLSKKNLSGVCMTHLHTPGQCRCPRCIKTSVSRGEPLTRPGTRVVSVASHIAVNSGGSPKVRVSLPCEPWLPPNELPPPKLPAMLLPQRKHVLNNVVLLLHADSVVSMHSITPAATLAFFFVQRLHFASG